MVDNSNILKEVTKLQEPPPLIPDNIYFHDFAIANTNENIK